jgi:hypothetical protein
MIQNISGGPGIVVQGGHSNQIYLQASQPGSAIPAGQLRYNNNMIEVFDGSSWRTASNSYTNISLDVGMIEAIEWARRKMQEEKELEDLAKQFPILEDAMRDLEVIKVLVRGKRNNDIQQN